MAATTKNEGDDTATQTTAKAPTGKTTSAKGTAAKSEPPREELGGVIRTSRTGPIHWNGSTSGSTPDQLKERRHEKLDEAKKPGDEGYSPYKDPLVPSSSLAAVIAAELAAEDGDGESPTWNALNEAHQAEYEEYNALKEFRESRQKAAS